MSFPIARLCPELDDPDNGQVVLTGRTRFSTATYTCDEEFEFVGRTCIRVCEDDGEWSGEEPECLRTLVVVVVRGQT